MRDALGDPSVPLWVTEGTKKADCGVHYQLCIVALSGVWNWRGTNDMGGKTAVADWNDIALNGRRVILAFDGDVARKPSAAKALCALADYLRYRGAKVEYLHLPDTDEKTGLDDYLVADHTVEDLWRLVKPHQPRPADDAGEQRPDQARAETRTGATRPPEQGAGRLQEMAAHGRHRAGPRRGRRRRRQPRRRRPGVAAHRRPTLRRQDRDPVVLLGTALHGVRGHHHRSRAAVRHGQT